VDLSVAQGRSTEPRAAGGAEATIDRRLALATGVLLALAAAAIYLLTRVDRFYDHFVWQAAAFLEGQAAIRYPVEAAGSSIGNWFFQDVLPIETSDGVRRGLLPFPPLPALLVVPFVAVWGIATDDQTLFTLLAALDVALCWWMLGGLRIGPVVRLGTTLFFAFGTVFWYAAEVATTWYQAHIVAVGLTLVAIGLALRADPAADEVPEPDADEVPEPDADGLPIAPDPRTAPGPVDRRQALIGGLFGLAATARLTVIFGAPFFALVGAGGGFWRRAGSAALGAAIPVLLLVAYNLGTTGQILHPAYDYLYRLETAAYTGLGYRADWAVEDPRYLPQNAAIMFLAPPDVFPERLPDSLGVNDTPVCQAPAATRGLFDPACPLAVPRDIGMSVLLTSPAYLLLLPALGRWRRSRLVAGASLAVLLVVIVNLMHFSQGWVQFGYRFSLDAAPFALVLVALGWQRLVAGGRRWAMPVAAALVVVSIAVNAWGVLWGRLLGW
jgi:hypothetical protein